MPSVMPVATAASRASRDPESIRGVSVVIPRSSVNGEGDEGLRPRIAFADVARVVHLAVDDPGRQLHFTKARR